MGFRHSVPPALATLVLALVVPVAASGPAFAAAPERTVARLGIATPAVHVRQQVRFTLADSRVATGRTVKSAHISFGDGTTATVRGLTATTSHAYRSAGVRVATLTLVDSAGAKSTARRTFVVAAKDELRFRSTTKRYGSTAVTAVRWIDTKRVRVTLRAGQHVPKLKETVLVGPGGIVPQGLAVVAETVVRGAHGTHVVSGHRAGLSRIYSTLRSATSATVGANLQRTDTRPGTRQTARAVSAKAVPFSCKVSGTNDRPLSVTADLSQTKIWPTIDIGSRIFQLVVIAKPTFSVGVSFGGKAECSLGSNYFALDIPVPAVPGLIVSISPYFSLSATGSISTDYTYEPSFFVDITRSPSRNSNWMKFVPKTTVSAKGTASITLRGGIGISVSAGGAVGLSAQFGPKLQVSASIDASGRSCFSATSSIEALVKLFADAFFTSAEVVFFDKEYYKSVLATGCSPTGSGGGSASGGGSSIGSGSPGPGGGRATPNGPASVGASNNNGQMAVGLTNFPLGVTYYFCHTGSPGEYPTGGTVTRRGQLSLTSFDSSYLSGLCAGEGNSWIGLQTTDGHDVYSNQTTLHYTPPSVVATNNNGQLALALSNLPQGVTYYFCHSGSAADYPRGGNVIARGQFTVTGASVSFSTGICAGSGTTWVGLQASDGNDYYSNQTNLHYQPPTVNATNNNGEMSVALNSFPLGTAYYFCHSGNPSDYPSGGSITNRGRLTVSAADQSWPSGLCHGRGNAWVGFQSADGHDYFGNQVNLVAAQTPGAGVSVSNNRGQMAVQLTNFPLGTTYFFCHSGNPSDYPTGGVVTNHGQVQVTSPNQSWTSGWCSGRGNAWIGIQATDGADYYSNQVDLYAPPTAGAGIYASGANGRLSLQVSNFPTGTTYYFCHTGSPSEYPTGGSVPQRGQLTITDPNQNLGVLCSGSGNFWVGVQATDGHDYYSNQVQL